jgi:hypothetical protein
VCIFTTLDRGLRLCVIVMEGKSTSSSPEECIDTTYMRESAGLDAVSTEAIKAQMKRYDHKGSDGLHRWVAMPNHSFADMTLGVCSGAVTALTPDAPVFEDMFSKRDFGTAGTAMVEIIKTKDDSPLSDAYFRSSGMLDKLVAAIPISNSTENIITNDAHRDIRTNGDKAPWVAALGGTGGYLGVYKMMQTTELGSEEKYYIVVRSSAPGVSSDLVRWLQNLEADAGGNSRSSQISAEDLSSKALHTKFAYNAGRRNRARLLSVAANALGVCIRQGEDSSAVLSEEAMRAGERKPMKAIPDIDNASHILRYFPPKLSTKKGTVVYYNNTTPTDRNIRGVIVSDSARVGPQIHCAKKSTGNTYCGWKHDKTYHAYPMDSGRKLKTRQLAENAREGKRDSQFSWSGSTKWNEQLVPGYYGKIDSEFTQKTGMLGRNKDMEVVQLHPVLVVLKPMPERGASLAGRM